MRYLVLTADRYSFLRDEYDRDFDCSSLLLSADLRARIEQWYHDYLPVIRLNTAERMAIKADILLLDSRGIELASEIVAALIDVKVRYYSEGWLRYY